LSPATIPIETVVRQAWESASIEPEQESSAPSLLSMIVISQPNYTHAFACLHVASQGFVDLLERSWGLMCQSGLLPGPAPSWRRRRQPRCLQKARRGLQKARNCLQKARSRALPQRTKTCSKAGLKNPIRGPMRLAAASQRARHRGRALMRGMGRRTNPLRRRRDHPVG
jgi:hypothetical protein